jgi:hypothetical protein
MGGILSVPAGGGGIAFGGATLPVIPEGWVETTGYQEKCSQSDQEMIRVFQGPWTNRLTFVRWALGYSYNQPAPGPPAAPTSGSLSRVPPINDPEMPWLYASECQLLEPQGAWGINPTVFEVDGNGNNFLDQNGNPILAGKIGYFETSTGTDAYTARYAVRFIPRLYEVRSDNEMLNLPNTQLELERWVERKTKYAMQVIQTPGTLTFVPGTPVAGQPVSANAALQYFPTQELQYLWYEVPDVPEDAIQACVGQVNSDPFDGARGAKLYPAQTLLCLPPDRERTPRTILGRVCWTLTYRFAYRPTGWNLFPNGVDQNFYLATRDGTVNGTRLYAVANFAKLFTQPIPVSYQ